jgi:hypothetical protein
MGMKILAIDPGTTQSAFVVWDTDRQEFIGLKMGIVDNDLLLKSIDEYAVDADLIAIEAVQNYGFQMGRTTIETIMFTGALRQESSVMCSWATVKLYGRPTIKGHFNAKNDATIRSSLRMRYGEARKGEKLEGVKKDIWSALALAVALTENPKLKEW